MPINCCQNTTATTTFLPVTSCCCCCSCSNPVKKPTMQKATIESRAMRDAAAAVANGQNGFLLCVGCHFIVHVAGDAAAACCRCCHCRKCCCRLCCCCAIKLSARVIKTEAEKTKSKRKAQNEKNENHSSSQTVAWIIHESMNECI